MLNVADELETEVEARIKHTRITRHFLPEKFRIQITFSQFNIEFCTEMIRERILYSKCTLSWKESEASRTFLVEKHFSWSINFNFEYGMPNKKWIYRVWCNNWGFLTSVMRKTDLRNYFIMKAIYSVNIISLYYKTK